MKILEAYYNLKLRTGMKKYLLAENKSLSEIDRLYRQFGTYLSRLKGVKLYNDLLNCSSETDFRTMLKVIFKEKWAGHMQYEEMPTYFERYLDYLHSACALDPTLEIEGLEMPADLFCLPGSDVTEYAKPYVRDGKLSIIANPLLIKKLTPYIKIKNVDMQGAIETARSFYGSLLEDMTDKDWESLIEEIASPKKQRKAKATARNVEIIGEDGQKSILGGNKAMEHIVREVGPQKFLSMNVQHKGDRIVTRTPDPRYPTYYVKLDDGLWLNVKGSVAEKVKTLRLLTMLLHLPYTVTLTNELPE